MVYGHTFAIPASRPRPARMMRKKKTRPTGRQMVLNLNRAPAHGAGAPVGVWEGFMDQAVMASGARSDDRFDDEDYPAYSMGTAAEMVGVTPAFLRALGAAKLIEPRRSEGGHRRYSRYQLRLAARARELVDQGTGLEAACRIIILEDQLAEALRINAELRRSRALHGDRQGR
ncbi:hypothetical protein GCM10010412_016450 [Nonomuraea recticatena]